MADDHYMLYDLDGVVTFVTPEFALMSRGRPCKIHRRIQLDCDDCEGGIGWRWYAKYKDDLFPSDEVPVPGFGVVKGMPRYYEKLFEVEDSLTLAEIKKVRQEFMKAHAEDYTPQRLFSKYKVAKDRCSLLNRSL
jgi:hypothetical protein